MGLHRTIVTLHAGGLSSRGKHNLSKLEKKCPRPVLAKKKKKKEKKIMVERCPAAPDSWH